MTVRRGFTLPEVVAVLAIVGLVFAIAIPGLLDALSRRKQRSTMVDIRAIAEAVESHAVDNTFYPASGWTPMPNFGSVGSIRSRLEPTYIAKLPVADGWKNTIYYGRSGSRNYQVASYGADGGPSPSSGRANTDFDDDIVFENGRFVVYPAGVQE